MIKTYDEFPGEEFKAITEYDGVSVSGYEVSKTGKVLSFRRNKRVLLKGWIEADGYRIVQIYFGKGKKKYAKVSRLVALTWIPKIVGKEYVLHGDGIKSNNSVDNLRWGTALENADDSKQHGSQYMPSKFGEKKLTTEQVIQIRDAYAAGAKIKRIAINFNVTRQNIYAIVRRETWCYV